jgi:hypothetical protein
MKKIISLLFFTLLMSVSAFAHQAFTLISSERRTVKETELTTLEKDQTTGKKDKTNLIFTEKEIRLIILTGPEEDMLSYRIQGVRNANLVVPSGATLRILFVNVDTDMRHDVLFGHMPGDFPVAPNTTGTAGSQKLTARTADGSLQAEEIVVKAAENGAFKYFCSVRGHAKGGMWGNILVGVKPGADLKTAEKTVHVHSPDEDKDENKPHSHDEKKDAAKSDNKPNDEMSDLKTNDKKSEETSGMAGMSHNKSDVKDMSGMNHGSEMKMRSTVNINDPMSRESSGTAWQSDSTPMYGYMKTFGNGDMLMLHGTMFARYTNVGSKRDLSVAGDGDNTRFDAPSMFMAMYSHQLTNKTQIGLRAMMSLDPIIQRGYGYPLLYQSGETHKGRHIHDRQHPHDFISELSATISHKLTEKQSVYFYFGYPGEPALGPAMFMHRLSGMNNPDAPISHHWQDSSHISFGVMTAGYAYDKFKFEVSAFNGTEPDENRWNFEKPKFNSVSARLSWNPTKELALQVSHGYLVNPERTTLFINCYALPYKIELQPKSCRDKQRTTASVIYNKNLGNDKNWANTFVWGRLNDVDYKNNTSFLYETDFQFQKNSIFGRVERVQKNSHELDLVNPHPAGLHWVGTYSVGYVRDIVRDKGIDVGIGVQGTLNTNPQVFAGYYGGKTHGGYQFFMRFRPSRMKH